MDRDEGSKVDIRSLGIISNATDGFNPRKRATSMRTVGSSSDGYGMIQIHAGIDPIPPFLRTVGMEENDLSSVTSRKCACPYT